MNKIYIINENKVKQTKFKSLRKSRINFIKNLFKIKKKYKIYEENNVKTNKLNINNIYILDDTGKDKDKHKNNFFENICNKLRFSL